MKSYPYIEPTIRTIAGGLVTAGGAMMVWKPELLALWLPLLLFVGLNLFQSGLTRFCLMEKLLKRVGFRSELDEIRDMAMHDALTGLPNRLLLEDRIEMAIAQARRAGHKVGMLFIDLDNFKQVNDVHGHKAGDKLLLAVSAVLKQNLRTADTLARWGGDEFVVLIGDLEQIDDAHAVAEKLMQAVHHELLVEHMDSYVTLSIGIAVFPDDADSCETLLVQADKALFFSKSQGRNNIQVFSEMRERGLGYRDFDMTSRFAAAVKQRRIQVHYQPIVDARSSVPVGVEALARWHDDKYGWVSPAVFIPMAENLGLIHEVGQQVLEQALHDFSHCPVRDSALHLSVNISNRQLFSNTCIQTLTRLVEQHGIPPHKLKLEVTESIAHGTGNARKALEELAAAGFPISLDDFGTGFSSLSRLHELKADELKIDMSFVRRVKSREGRIMMKTIVDMGRALNLALVAEGVEDAETAEILREMGVPMLQGYYFSPPMTKEDCVRFMLARLEVRAPLSPDTGCRPLRGAPA